MWLPAWRPPERMFTMGNRQNGVAAIGQVLPQRHSAGPGGSARHALPRERIVAGRIRVRFREALPVGLGPKARWSGSVTNA